jgi:hypothetical protein
MDLSPEDKSDMLDITDNSPIFFRQLATLILNGTLGGASQYERLKKAPPRRRSARLAVATSASTDPIDGSGPLLDEPDTIAIPNSVRAYSYYIEQVPSFQPLQSLPGAVKLQPSVTHLTVDRVHLAMRQKYIGSKVRYWNSI